MPVEEAGGDPPARDVDGPARVMGPVIGHAGDATPVHGDFRILHLAAEDVQDATPAEDEVGRAVVDGGRRELTFAPSPCDNESVDVERGGATVLGAHPVRGIGRTCASR